MKTRCLSKNVPGWRLMSAAMLAYLLCSSSLFAQDLLQNLQRTDTTTGAGSLSTGTQDISTLPYTMKAGDLRLLVAPTLEVDYNDNINAVTTHEQKDIILLPIMQLTGTYPVTARNILTLSAGIGYAEYLKYSQYNGLRINGGSQLAFDVFIGDVRINFHDSASDSQDTGAQGAVAGTAEYGGLNNRLGVTGIWNLHDFTFTLGYDHNNYISSASQFSYLNYSSENPVAQAGFHIRPNLTAGLEATAAFTDYTQQVLNNSQNYSLGAYGIWKPDPFFVITVRGGYSLFDFNETSQSGEIFLESPNGELTPPPLGMNLRTANQSSWYGSINLTHSITERVNYNLLFTHEIVPGIQSDASELTSVGLSGNWAMTKAVSLNANISYQHGQQGVGNISGNLTETYDFVYGSLYASYNITSAMSLRLGYRRSQRFSNMEDGSYGQDLVSLSFTYRFL